MAILDLFFPKRCVNCKKMGGYLCHVCFSFITFNEKNMCCVCKKPAIGGFTHPVCKNSLAIDGVFSSLIYVGVVKKLIYTFKYQPYLTDLKPLLVDLFYEGIIQKEAFYKSVTDDSVLIPVPLHKSRLKKRGYNQSLLLANGLAEKFGMEVSDCLDRVKNTPTQVGLNQIKRQENIKDAFALKIDQIPVVKKFENAILVDDVVTSGATLSEAAKVLKKAGIAKVWGITLAHAI